MPELTNAWPHKKAAPVVVPDAVVAASAHYEGFAHALRQRHPGADDSGRVVRAPLEGMGRTRRTLQPDGSWVDDFGKLCPAPGKTTYGSGQPEGTSPMTVAPE